MRGLRRDEYELLDDVSGVKGCGGEPGESDDNEPYSARDIATAERLIARELLREDECTCGWIHYRITSLGRTAVSIHEQAMALLGAPP